MAGKCENFMNPKYLEGILEEAEKSLAEAIKNGTQSDWIWWKGYRECAQRIVNAHRKLSKPLTLEELREMDGEPVFVKKNTGAGIRIDNGWALVDAASGWIRLKTGSVMHFIGQGGYGKQWMAYRRKPEEGTV